MSAPAEIDPLVAHYAETVVMIEYLILRRFQRLPFMPALSGLSGREVEEIAARLAEAHDVAAEVSRRLDRRAT